MLVKKPVHFLIVGSPHDTCLPGCSCSQPITISKVLSQIALHHHMKTFHEVTSISSCADLNSQSVFPSTVSQRMDLCLEFRSTTTVCSYKQIAPANSDCWSANCSIHQKEYGQIHDNLRINFSIHHAVLDHFFIHHDLLIDCIIHHDLPKFSPRRRWDLSNSQPIHLIHFS